MLYICRKKQILRSTCFGFLVCCAYFIPGTSYHIMLQESSLFSVCTAIVIKRVCVVLHHSGSVIHVRCTQHRPGGTNSYDTKFIFAVAPGGKNTYTSRTAGYTAIPGAYRRMYVLKYHVVGYYQVLKYSTAAVASKG